ncbi:Uncharacterised protein [Halioglobus japonicus]|nr:Uncharacterised protein [Halioglobus japonicus]
MYFQLGGHGDSYIRSVNAFDATDVDQYWFVGGPQYDELTPAVDDNFVYTFTTKLDVINRVDGTLHTTIASPDLTGMVILVKLQPY